VAEKTKLVGEIRNAGRTLPSALRIGRTGVTLIYIAATVAFIYAVPLKHIAPDDAFVAQLGDALLGRGGGIAIATVVLVCVLGSLGAVVMFAAQLYFAMANDGVFSRCRGRASPQIGSPARAIAVLAVLASILVVFGTFNTIVEYFVFITVVFIALMVAGVFVVQWRDPPFTVAGHPWTAAIFLETVSVFACAARAKQRASSCAG
jgi:APA family basic amino acid/polyamine antiporter